MTPTLGYILAVLLVVFLVDLGLRAIPFLILEPLRESRFVRTMGVWILFVLAIVSVQSSLVSAPGKAWATIAASAITVAAHLLGGRRMMVSIAAGTLSYVLFINL